MRLFAVSTAPGKPFEAPQEAGLSFLHTMTSYFDEMVTAWWHLALYTCEC